MDLYTLVGILKHEYISVRRVGNPKEDQAKRIFVKHGDIKNIGIFLNDDRTLVEIAHMRQ